MQKIVHMQNFLRAMISVISKPFNNSKNSMPYLHFQLRAFLVFVKVHINYVIGYLYDNNKLDTLNTSQPNKSKYL